MDRSKLLIFGEIIWDVYSDRACIGGAPLNFAAHAAGLGADVSLLSAVGKDRLGEQALDLLNGWSIDCTYVQRNEWPTGRCEVTLDRFSIPSYRVLTDAAYDRITLSDAELAALQADQFDAFYFGTLAQRGVSRTALERLLTACHFKSIFCDLNLRPANYDRQSVENCLKYATILKFSDEEAPLLQTAARLPEEEASETAQRLLCLCPDLSIVLLTVGAAGAKAFTADGNSFFAPAEPVKPVSTVGAGDSFGAAWLCSYLNGDSIEEALRKANHRAAWVVAHAEAIPLERFG